MTKRTASIRSTPSSSPSGLLSTPSSMRSTSHAPTVQRGSYEQRSSQSTPSTSSNLSTPSSTRSTSSFASTQDRRSTGNKALPSCFKTPSKNSPPSSTSQPSAKRVKGTAADPISLTELLDDDLAANRSRKRRHRSRTVLSSSSSSDSDSDSDSNSDSDSDSDSDSSSSNSSASSSTSSDSESGVPPASQKTRINLTWLESFTLVEFVRRSKTGKHVGWTNVRDLFIERHATCRDLLDVQFLRRKFMAIRKEWLANQAKPKKWSKVPKGAAVHALKRLGFSTKRRRTREWRNQRRHRRENWSVLGRMLEDIGTEFSLDGTDRRRSASQLRGTDQSMKVEKASLRSKSIRSLNSAVLQQAYTLESIVESNNATNLLAYANAQAAITNTIARLRESLAADLTEGERESILLQILLQQEIATASAKQIKAWLRKNAEEEEKEPDESE